MFLEADTELDKIDPFNRAAPEVLALRIAIYRGLEKWELMQEIAKRLADLQPGDIQWTILARVCDSASRFDSGSERSSAECGVEVSKRGCDKIQFGVLFFSDRRHPKCRTLFKKSI